VGTTEGAPTLSRTRVASFSDRVLIWTDTAEAAPESVRGLLIGAPMQPHSVLLAVAWCAVIGLAGYAWAKRLFNRA
jgi:hypothetical protein